MDRNAFVNKWGQEYQQEAFADDVDALLANEVAEETKVLGDLVENLEDECDEARLCLAENRLIALYIFNGGTSPENAEAHARKALVEWICTGGAQDAEAVHKKLGQFGEEIHRLYAAEVCRLEQQLDSAKDEAADLCAQLSALHDRVG